MMYTDGSISICKVPFFFTFYLIIFFYYYYFASVLHRKYDFLTANKYAYLYFILEHVKMEELCKN